MAEGNVLTLPLAGSSAMFKYVLYSYKWTTTIAAGGYAQFSANKFKDSNGNPVSTPEGYSVMGVARFTSGTTACGVTFINPFATGTEYMMNIKNNNNASHSGYTAMIGITYIKTDFVDAT